MGRDIQLLNPAGPLNFFSMFDVCSINNSNRRYKKIKTSEYRIVYVHRLTTKL